VDFQLTSEHQLVQRSVREFAQREAAPHIKSLDRDQRPDRGLIDRMGELGLLGVCIPVGLGGQGMDYISLGLACEELEAVDSSLRVVLSVHLGLNSLGLLQWANDEQKGRLLEPQASGRRLAAFGLTEPGAGSDVAAIRSTARPVDGGYVLNGEKTWISLASLADHVLWFARTGEDQVETHRSLTAFVVETNAPGVRRGDHHGKLGMRAGSTGWLTCDDVFVPGANRLGEEGEGFRIAMSCLDGGRYTVAAGATGLIRACLEQSLAYSQQRETFGRPRWQHQLIQAKLADMVQSYEIARLLYLRAGWMKNSGQRNTLESSLAKWYSTEAAVKAASDAVQIHGAYGYSDEFDVERYLRNARGGTIYEGTSEIHTLLQAEFALGVRSNPALRRELPAYDPATWQMEPSRGST
jgi:glutaryl-CoA dehydrogenase (non-decarboxylating)